jgi:plastocyanin
VAAFGTKVGLGKVAEATQTQAMIRRVALLTTFLVLFTSGSASAATATVTVTNSAFTPATQTVALGNSLRWQNTSGKKHNATPIVNWSWGGVTVRAGRTSAAVYPTQAGSFPYFCSLHPSRHKGTIAVPLTVDQLAGTVGTFFNFTLGTVQAPGVSVHELWVRQNGGQWALRVSTQAPTVSIMFTSAGTWDVRTIMRWQLGSATSGWSPITTLSVF